MLLSTDQKESVEMAYLRSRVSGLELIVRELLTKNQELRQILSPEASFKWINRDATMTRGSFVPLTACVTHASASKLLRPRSVLD